MKRSREGVMHPDVWRTVKTEFERVRAMDPEAARAYFADARAADAEVRAEVLSLLRAHQRSEGFLETPATFDPGTLDDEIEDSLVGRRLGPYLILRELGRGGMGVVYEASREVDEFQQRVAVKVVHTGPSGAAMQERFRTERQILARLDHPHIARLIDVGTVPDGRPYFVMELVDGLPLEHHCARAALPLEARLRLFVDVAMAVHAAHRHLVVHRDFKPTNVLVTPAGVPKLLDFGIAKLLDVDGFGTNRPLTVDVLPMTPRYASPEQIRGEPVTTATDIYSLGVLLYELLTGQGPYRLSSTAAHELGEAICSQEPTAPNLGGDLDTILLKALQKDPDRRYGTALQFAEDINRYLDGLPVLARPDTASYRLRKFVGRHRTACALGALSVVLLLAAFVATAWQYGVAARERGRAERRFDQVRQLANTFMFDIHDAIRTLPGSTPARQRLVVTALEYLDSLNQDASGDWELARELAAAYERVAAIQGETGAANVGDKKGAIENQQKAVTLREARFRAMPSDADAKLEWAGSLGALAQALSTFDSQAALVAAEDAARVVEEPPEHLSTERTRALEVEIYYALGSSRVAVGQVDEGVRAFETCLETLERTLRDNPDHQSARRDLTLTSKRLGAILGMNNRTTEARARYEQALRVEQDLLKADPLSVPLRRDLSVTYSDMGWLFRKMGDAPSALEHYRLAYAIRTALADADPANADMQWMLSSTMGNLGSVLGDQRQWPEAESFLQRAAELRAGLARRDPANLALSGALAQAYSDLGQLAFAAGRLGDAAHEHERALEVVETLATRDPSNRQYLVDRGRFSASAGRAYLSMASTADKPADRCRAARSAGALLTRGVDELRQLAADRRLLEDDLAVLRLIEAWRDESAVVLADCR